MGTKVPLYECHHWIILKGKSEPDNQHEILTLQQIYRKIFVFVMIFLEFCIEGSRKYFANLRFLNCSVISSAVSSLQSV